MADEDTLVSVADDTQDLRALVSGMLGPEQVEHLDAGSLRALSTVLLERLMFSRQAGLSFHGARDMYEVLGYNRVLTYRDYRARYARGGIAKRIIDAYPNAIWRGGAEVFEDENVETDTEFEAAWKGLEARLGIWSRLQRAHKLALLSTYSVILLGAPGDLSTELPRVSGPDKLLYLTPFSGGGGPGGDQTSRSMAMNADASIMTFETDPSNPRFGLPNTYQLKRTDLSSPLLNRPVHWSRIIHVAEGILNDEVYGTPGMESTFNLLDDLDKVVGGGAEAFWLRANAGLHVDFDKTMGMLGKPGQPVQASGLTTEQAKAFEEKAQKLQHQLERVMVTRGANVTQLSSATADFSRPADAIVTQIAGTIGIPKRILVGSEMGQLASGQDKDNWNTQVQDRRTSWAFPSLVKPLIDRLVEYGYLPKPKEVHVDWPVIEDLTQDEKVKLQIDMANVNKIQEAVVYTEEEIRDVVGIDPLTDEQANEGQSEIQKAEIAAKLALTNKEMGQVVFTNADIRRISYGYEPLPDSEIVPIGAPEKISVGMAPKLGEVGQPVEQPAAEPLAAQLAALEAAIEADDLGSVGEILGLGSRHIDRVVELRKK